MIYLALSNVIENAVQYSNQQIIVDVKQLGDARICLSDGPGIPVKERKSVFSPYYRLDERQNRGTGGVGLGLALVDIIVKKHGGEVKAMNSTLKGARIEMIWDAD